MRGGAGRGEGEENAGEEGEEEGREEGGHEVGGGGASNSAFYFCIRVGDQWNVCSGDKGRRGGSLYVCMCMCACAHVYINEEIRTRFLPLPVHP